LLQQHVQRGLENLLVSPLGESVREGVLRDVELLQEAARHRHVKAKAVRRERLNFIRPGFRRGGGRAGVRCAFNRLNCALTCVRDDAAAAKSGGTIASGAAAVEPGMSGAAAVDRGAGRGVAVRDRVLSALSAGAYCRRTVESW
jgi:hypothetical protein